MAEDRVADQKTRPITGKTMNAVLARLAHDLQAVGDRLDPRGTLPPGRTRTKRDHLRRDPPRPGMRSARFCGAHADHSHRAVRREFCAGHDRRKTRRVITSRRLPVDSLDLPTREEGGSEDPD